MSKNVKRRHLTVSQRAAIVVEFLPALEAEARERMARPGDPRRGEHAPAPVSSAPGTQANGHRAREDAGALAVEQAIARGLVEKVETKAKR